jgi:hypothetical protein
VHALVQDSWRENHALPNLLSQVSTVLASLPDHFPKSDHLHQLFNCSLILCANLVWRVQTPYREKGSGHQPIRELPHSPGFLGNSTFSVLHNMDSGLFTSGSAKPSLARCAWQTSVQPYT